MGRSLSTRLLRHLRYQVQARRHLLSLEPVAFYIYININLFLKNLGI